LLLPTLPKASTEHSMLTALTMCSGPEVAEEVLMMICRNRETIRKYRREIRVAHAKLPSKLVWAEIFPAANPPPAVSIEPAKRKPKSNYHGIHRAAYSVFPRIANIKPSWTSIPPAIICRQLVQADDSNHRYLKPKPRY